jgi:hypothetical protein
MKEEKRISSSYDASARRRRCLVRAARRAAALRDFGDRRRAAAVAWRESALRDAAARPWRLSARRVARDRRVDGWLRRLAARLADAALRFVEAFALAGGRGSFTPARLAFERPIAIACFVEAAPCLPSRT